MYAQDFEVDTAYWTVEEIGVYIRLLNVCWVNNGLPMDMYKLARIARVDASLFATVWTETVSKKFFEQDGQFFNARQEEVRAFRKKQKENGSKGGRPKKENQEETQTKPNKNPNTNLSNEIEIEKEIELVTGEKEGAGGKEEDQAKPLLDKLCEAFKITELRNAKSYFALSHFSRSSGCSLEYFTSYLDYKRESGEKMHSWYGFTGTKEENYKDGAWCSCDWNQKLLEFKNGDHKKTYGKPAGPRQAPVGVKHTGF